MPLRTTDQVLRGRETRTDGPDPAGLPAAPRRTTVTPHDLGLAAARRDLTADCSRCAGLCCVLPAFAASADFAVDKPAGTPCRHLRGPSTT